jgi:hypothetical protein
MLSDNLCLFGLSSIRILMYSQLLLAIQQSFIMFCHQPIMNHNVLDVCYCYGDKDDAAYTFFLFVCYILSKPHLRYQLWVRMILNQRGWNTKSKRQTCSPWTNITRFTKICRLFIFSPFPIIVKILHNWAQFTHIKRECIHVFSVSVANIDAICDVPNLNSCVLDIVFFIFYFLNSNMHLYTYVWYSGAALSGPIYEQFFYYYYLKMYQGKNNFYLDIV